MSVGSEGAGDGFVGDLGSGFVACAPHSGVRKGVRVTSEELFCHGRGEGGGDTGWRFQGEGDDAIRVKVR